MKKAQYSSFNKGSISLDYILTGVLLTLVFLALISVFLYYISATRETEETMISDTEFQDTLQTGGKLLLKGDKSEAILQFQRLAESAENPVQEGQAMLNLGVARMGVNREEAIEQLKAVAIDERYAPFTRAKAVYYVLGQYFGTQDNTLAEEHIFTGRVWGDFLSEGGSLNNAVIAALEFSTELAPTVEANMRLALEKAFQLWREDVTESEKEILVNEIQSLITGGDSQISQLQASGNLKYGSTFFTEVVSAFNSKAMALDILYFNGHIDNPALVEEAFRDALDLSMDYEGGTGMELFVRYNYADFLLRLDAENRSSTISTILAPMSQLTPNENFAVFIRNWISRDGLVDPEETGRLARPYNIPRLAAISPEFRQALIRIGVPEEQL